MEKVPRRKYSTFHERARRQVPEIKQNVEILISNACDTGYVPVCSGDGAMAGLKLPINDMLLTPMMNEGRIIPASVT